MAAWLQGEHDRARSLLAEALALQSLDEDRAEMLLSTGLVELEAGEHRRAEHTLAQVLRLGLGRHVVWLASPTLEGLAGVAVRDGRMEQAVRLFGAADALRRRIGTPLTPLHRPLYERHVAAAGTVLGQEQLDKLSEEGRAMALEQAMSHALGDDTGPEGTRGVETASGIAVLPPGRSHE
jgi:tetratricopeptide (TPR) repeat protein